MTATATQTEVHERPIIFSGPMVRAVLEGRKTQTRRVIVFRDAGKQFHFDNANPLHSWNFDATKGEFYYGASVFNCPYGRVGYRLWVRETWRIGDGANSSGDASKPTFAADWQSDLDSIPVKWKSPLFLPRDLSRLTLEITNVRAERLQEISEEDAIAEGLQRSERTDLYPSPQGNCEFATWAYRYAWDSINAKRGYSWASNPWVWVIEFKKL